MKTRFVLAVVLVSVILASVPFMTSSTTATAQNGDWADECKDAQVIEPGAYNGSLSPDEMDVFAVNISDGDYVEVNLSFSGGAEDVRIHVNTNEDGFSDGSLAAKSGASIKDVYSDSAFLNAPDLATLNKIDGTYQLRIYSEGPGPVCVQLETKRTAGAVWKLAFDQEQPDVPPVDC